MKGKEQNGTVFTVRIIGGRERMVAKLIRGHARSSDHPVYSIIVPGGMKGYIFVEAGSLGAVKRVVEGVKPVKSVMSDPSTPDELENVLEPKTDASNFEEGDKVEIVEGGLKGRKGEVAEVKPKQEEVVVKVDDPAVPAPLTVAPEEIERE